MQRQIAAGRQPVWYAVAGGILSVAIGIGATLLALTVVGLPASVLLLTSLALAWMLGTVALCQWVGDRIPPAARLGGWASFLAGAAVLGAVGLVPFVGSVVLAFAALLAVGAGLVTRLGTQVVD